MDLALFQVDEAWLVGATGAFEGSFENIKCMFIVLEGFRPVLLEELNCCYVDEDLGGAELVQILRLVMALDAKQALLVELGLQIEVFVLSQYVCYLVQYAEGIILSAAALLKSLFQGLHSGLALVKLVDSQVQISQP